MNNCLATEVAIGRQPVSMEQYETLFLHSLFILIIHFNIYLNGSFRFISNPSTPQISHFTHFTLLHIFFIFFASYSHPPYSPPPSPSLYTAVCVAPVVASGRAPRDAASRPGRGDNFVSDSESSSSDPSTEWEGQGGFN